MAGTPSGRGGTPGTPSLLRAINDRAALELLLERGPLSRSELGSLTGLSKPTASQLLSRLEAAGLVLPVGTSRGRPGPGAQLYEINPAAGYVAGLDVTPSGIRAAVADLTGRIVGEYQLPTPGSHAAGTAERVAVAVDGAAKAAELERTALRQVVIGTPGALDPNTGRLRYAPHLPGWHSPRLDADLADRLGVPVALENDVNLAAVAEQRLGQARGTDDFLLLWAAEGVGAAIVLGGRLHRGHTGGAGEVGYMPLPGAPLIRDVRRRNSGGFQELVGAPAVLALARQHGISARSAPQAVAAALTAPAGEALLADLADRLATGLAALVAVIDPELVVLAGETPQAGGERLRELVQEGLTGLAVLRPRLVLGSVPGSPVLAGALQSALDTAREAVFSTHAPH